MKKKLLLLLLSPLLLSARENPCCINTPARSYPAECSGFFLFVDPLLWKGEIGGAGISVTTTTSKSQVSNLNFNLNWGVRIGLGYNTSFDAFETLLIWTHFENSASRKLSSTETNFPTWGSAPIALEGKGKWSLSYNILDLENGRQFYVGNCFILRPHAGLRSAWINQKDYNLNYSLPTETIKIYQQDRSYGIGIRGGMDMQWNLTSSFSLFSNYAGALLYSYHSVKHQRISNFFHIASAIFDAQIGLRFVTSFNSCCTFLNFDLGWENHWLPGQNQFMLFVNDTLPGKFVQNQGDLGITGLFLRARLDF